MINKIYCNSCDKKIKQIYKDIYTCKCLNIVCSNCNATHKCNYDYKKDFIKNNKLQLINLNSKVEKI